MSRMLDLVRASALASHQMMSASKGALRLPAAEMLEILVYIAEHNKIFGESARMTLAGWDEASALQTAANPKTAPEVLNYWISPKNLRPALLPVLIENPAVTNTQLGELATTLKNEMLDVLIASPRVRNSRQVLQDLSTNNYLSGVQRARVNSLITGEPLIEGKDTTVVSEEPMQDSQVVVAPETILEPEPQASFQPTEVSTPMPNFRAEKDENILADDPEAEAVLKVFLTEHAKEIASEPEKPFHAIGGMHEEICLVDEPAPEKAMAASAVASAAVMPPVASPANRPHTGPKHPAKPVDNRRDSVLQKISKLDIKGRIQLAVKGTKEERAILVRDGTKIVALAVLDSPKITDGEVEKFATQKNVLENLLRAIPMKRRFAKNYAVVRGLVCNPRTPLDVALGLMKNLLVADLKNLSGNKEVAETVRKLALRMYKQKNEAANKK